MTRRDHYHHRRHHNHQPLIGKLGGVQTTGLASMADPKGTVKAWRSINEDQHHPRIISSTHSCVEGDDMMVVMLMVIFIYLY